MAAQLSSTLSFPQGCFETSNLRQAQEPRSPANFGALFNCVIPSKKLPRTTATPITLSPPIKQLEEENSPEWPEENGTFLVKATTGAWVHVSWADFRNRFEHSAAGRVVFSEIANELANDFTTEPASQRLIVLWDPTVGRSLAGHLKYGSLSKPRDLHTERAENFVVFEPHEYIRVFVEEGKEVFPFSVRSAANVWLRRTFAENRNHRAQVEWFGECPCGAFSFYTLGTSGKDKFKRPSVLKKHLAECRSIADHPLRRLCGLEIRGPRRDRASSRAPHMTESDTAQMQRQPQTTARILDSSNWLLPTSYPSQTGYTQSTTQPTSQSRVQCLSPYQYQASEFQTPPSYQYVESRPALR
ncbi:hypothetical protein BT69DRAFT_1326487 [Atractiella rhizophila]|nr:hypothetical protein BT69DRAFT_1326487 [Atractiella rhizophila]